MDFYTISAGGTWRRYHATGVPEGWRMLGTIYSEKDGVTGALGRSPNGLYAMFTAGKLRRLDQRAVATALARVRVLEAHRD